MRGFFWQCSGSIEQAAGLEGEIVCPSRPTGSLHAGRCFACLLGPVVKGRIGVPFRELFLFIQWRT